jgi:predicted amidophosphoribosyltransferase
MRGRGGGRKVSCPACGYALSRYTATCPNCGTPQPHKRLGGSLGLGLLIVILFALILYSAFSGTPAP